MADKKMWAVLMHLGSNMWSSKGYNPSTKDPEDSIYRDELYCQKDIWTKVTAHFPEWHINTLFIDIGEGVILDSHPEIAIKGAWTKSELRSELTRLRGMGVTPLPKFNFSAGHSAWMGDWAYRIGAPEFNRFCKDVIEETIELFDTPEFFHVGLEEEDYESQRNNYIAIVRSPDKKCADANFLFDVITGKGSRPCIWIDTNTVKSFGGVERLSDAIPKNVLLQPWYYHRIRDCDSIEDTRICKEAKLIRQLTDLGYEVMPTSSTWCWHLNSKETMKFCKKHVPDDSIKGFMTASWVFTHENKYYQLLNDTYTFYTAHRDVYGLEK